jgi:alpha-1,3-rhamnosyl/mannosyltransferase
VTEQFILPRVLHRWGVDGFHSTNYLVPPLLQVPTVVHCYDLTLVDHMETRKQGWMKYYERWVFLSGLHHARHVITPSRTVRRLLLDRFGLHSANVTAIYPFLEAFPHLSESVRIPPFCRKPFLLTVGTLEPRKNLERLLEAVELSWPTENLPWVLVGPYGWKQAGFLARLRRSRAETYWLGRVDDELLGELYRRATALVQFSRDEGFDYPVAEGLCFGTPLILSDIPIHREIAGDCAGYAPPDDPALLSTQIAATARWSSNRRRSYRSVAKQRASRYLSGSRVETYLEIYRMATNGVTT